MMTTHNNTDASADPHDLGRFLRAQEGIYATALGEIQNGRKTSHWMWFIFPQLQGLGSSATARLYAIRDLDEAAAYLAHPTLGSRLIACAEALRRVEGRSARQIFGTPDDLKLKSCATLFELVAPAGSVFARLLERYFEGERDGRTLELAGRGRS